MEPAARRQKGIDEVVDDLINQTNGMISGGDGQLESPDEGQAGLFRCAGKLETAAKRIKEAASRIKEAVLERNIAEEQSSAKKKFPELMAKNAHRRFRCTECNLRRKGKNFKWCEDCGEVSSCEKCVVECAGCYKEIKTCCAHGEDCVGKRDKDPTCSKCRYHETGSEEEDAMIRNNTE